MSEVTYYWDELGVQGWETSPENMLDGSLETYASTATENDRQALYSTNAPGTDLGTITKVEIRGYGYGDGDDIINFTFDGVLIDLYPITPGTDPDWFSYIDVTNDSHVDGWTWGKVEDLKRETPVHLTLLYTKSGKANTMYCAKVEIRVTYTPPAPPGKPTQYLAGLDCPAFPHEMDLMSDKLPCPLPY